ncbi:MAG: Ig-like domain-containing protein [Lachnospiraceae bacterium]|nr:Ig-like domain-containing protein [Lachnospiraceae bacterium]
MRKYKWKRVLAALLALSLAGSGLAFPTGRLQVNAQEVNREDLEDGSGVGAGTTLPVDETVSTEEETAAEKRDTAGTNENISASQKESADQEGGSSAEGVGEETSADTKEEGPSTEEAGGEASPDTEENGSSAEANEETSSDTEDVSTRKEDQAGAGEEGSALATGVRESEGASTGQEAKQASEGASGETKKEQTSPTEDAASVDVTGESEEPSSAWRLYSSAEVSQLQTETGEGKIFLSEEIWVEGFLQEDESLTYTGSEITQELQIYHHGILLREKLDYTLSYKNNIAAREYNLLNSPSVTITMKGHYSGSRTLYFTILPRRLSDCQPLEQEQTVDYRAELEFPAPVIYFGEQKLVEDRDFTCSYEELLGQLEADLENEPDAGVYEYSYSVNGKGNFIGSLTLEMTILADEKLNFSNAAIAFDQTRYEYRGAPLTMDDVGILFVKLGGEALPAELYTYQIKAENVGTGTVEIYPSEAGREAGYRGKKILKITVVGDREMKDTLPGDNWQAALVFSEKEILESGGIFQSQTGLLVYGEDREELIEGKDYRISYQNHKKAGKATVIFTGMGRYRGSVTRTYTILPNNDLKIIWEKTDGGEPIVPYMKNGAIPQFQLVEASGDGEAYVLQEKIDYTTRLMNNKKLGKMTCVIIGKGNYAGYYHAAEIEVVKGAISQGTIRVNDRPYSEKPREWQAPVTIIDLNGKVLKEGTDYSLSYSWPGMPSESGEGASGSDQEEVPPQGTQVTVTITGINYYEGETTATYGIYELSISSLRIFVDDQVYTGEAIELSKEDIHVYANEEDVRQGAELADAYGNIYEIIGYERNIETGLARVILRGKGSYGGTRTCFFNIRPAEYFTQRVTGISLEETTLYLGTGNRYQLTAVIEPADAPNQTLVWTSSDPQVAEVASDGTITAKEPGKTTITVISQDTGVKASCRVTVAIIPVSSFTLNMMEIEGEAGEEHFLEATRILPENASDKSIQWKSSNEQIATVDAEGKVVLSKTGMTVITATANSSGVVRKCLVIVKEKEDSGLSGAYITPQDCGAVENDETEDTAAFNQAISQLTDSCNTLYVPAGTYNIDALTRINLRSNMNLIMEEGAVLKAIGNSSSGYHIITGNNVRNVNISGGAIVGERSSHSGSTGEWGMGISLYDSRYINITGVEISDCWGDGIYLGSYNEADTNAGCRQINIRDCELFNNRRNNLSIVSADHVIVNNCSFRDANGTNPQYGIDIETNHSANPCEHILIANSIFSGNAMGSMGIITAANDVTISGCTLNGDFVNYAGTNVCILDSVINGEVNARIPVALEGSTRLNDYLGKDSSYNPEDTLVASFTPATKTYTLGNYRIDSANTMLKSILMDPASPSGQVVRIERMSNGSRESGYYLKLSELTGTAAALEAGATYRFEYTVKGSGQWGFDSSQTGWYPIVPMGDRYATGIVTYQAGLAGSCQIYLYAVSMAKGTHLEIDSLKIYKVN